MFRYGIRLFSCLSVLSFACLSLTGCGGSSSSSATSGTITGQAAKGPCAGSIATLHTVDAQGNLSAPIATDTTDQSGNYTLPIPAANANDTLAVRITGGTYSDEATGVTLTLTQELTGFLKNLDSDGESALQINPVTTLAFARVKDLIDEAAAENRQIPIEEAFTNAELQVRQALGIPDSIDIFKDEPGDLSAGEVTES
ncbi:MAG: hypothetical protein QF473_01570 [Planctomycetota bacterium]|jgi:hypothetical protein|nr:hypothetical protein [Planctomycetota bacterium]MDP6502308.1 hypothetical protein [Planctomycetota bacterium]